MKTIPFQSVRSKIFVLILTTILLSLMLIHGLIIRNVYTLIWEGHNSKQTEILQSISQNAVERHRKDMEMLIGYFSENEDLIDIFDNPEVRKSILKEWDLVRMLFPSRAWIYYGDEQNRIIVSPEWIPDDDYDCRERPWYKSAATSSGIVWPAPFIDVVTGKYVVTVAKKIENEYGITRGVLAVDTFISDFLDQLIIQAGNHEVPIFILTEDGNVIGNSLFPLSGKQKADTLEWESVIRESDSGRLTHHNETYYMSTYKIHSLNLTLGSLISEEALKSDLWPVQKALIIIYIFAILSSLLTAWMLSRYIAGNIERLYSYTQEIASPNSDIRICVSGRDELYSLNDSINKMILSTRNRGLEIQRLNRKLKEQVIRDNLTQAYNRYFLDEQFPKVLNQSLRDHSKLAVILLDIDHFKNVNDRYGHDTGDMILKEVCLLINNNIRTEDTLFRIGGEEFLLLTRQKDKNKIRSLAEKIRRIIEHHDFYTNNQLIRITISAGISCFPDHGKDRQCLQKKADKALYSAKSEGRNQTVLYKAG